VRDRIARQPQYKQIADLVVFIPATTAGSVPIMGFTQETVTRLDSHYRFFAVTFIVSQQVAAPARDGLPPDRETRKGASS
jgi:hypothetical protein